jgi:acyl-coenzyme A synthetase/AMP-(fatty) acid ligase
MPIGEPVRPGSMGRPLAGVDLRVHGGELVLADPATDPTFFIGHLGGGDAPADRPWHTGDRVRQDDDGYLYFEGRADDVIISAGYRIGPFEVESALVSHVAVAEAAVVAAPDEERGSVVRAVVVVRDGFAPSDELAAELQEHVKRETAPYKYPRIVEFVAELPKTTSGKVRRALLRAR